MKRSVQAACVLFVVLAALLPTSVQAALLVNSALPITQEIKVQVIAVADNAGANPAPLFGTPAQQALIFGMVDTIWAQAGIDVNFTFRSSTYNSTFALSGTSGNNNPRPTSDLNTIISNAASAGSVLSTDPNTLNLFMVQIVPGFSQTDGNTSNGLAFVGGNGITYWAGSNLLSFTAGQEVLASVLAHEIGHNMGLGHIVETENLMQASGSGARLNSTQIATAIASPFSTPIPEPSATMALVFGVFGLAARRRRAA